MKNQKQLISQKIHLIRGQRVMFDKDLAELYQVSAKRLNEQVKRNLSRFPEDFMFQLTEQEYNFLRSHFATLEMGRGKHRKYRPFVFTEYGVAMLSSVLRSETAIQVNIEIMRIFGNLRQIFEDNKELGRKLLELERRYDGQFKAVFDAIRQLINPTLPSVRRRIGFKW